MSDIFVFIVHISHPYSDSTCFTECDEDGKISLRKDRPFLIISSTSWTGKEYCVCIQDNTPATNKRLAIPWRLSVLNKFVYLMLHDY